MTESERPSLSEHGKRRRDDMLQTLLHEVARHQNRRKRRRQIALSAMPLVVLAIIAAIMYWPATTAPSPKSGGTVVVRERPVGAADKAATNIVLVTTDSQILERVRSNSKPQVEYISDDELLQAMHEMNQPVGLVRMEGHVMLTSNVSVQEGSLR